MFLLDYNMLFNRKNEDLDSKSVEFKMLLTVLW